jgi:hypothetical protein
MSRIFIDGFESGQDDLWDAESNATVISSAGLDMDGNYCLDLNGTAEYIEKNVTADDEMYFAFLYRPTNSTTSEEMIVLYYNSTVMLHLLRTNNITGNIKAHRGIFTLLDTGTHGLTINTTYLIEVRFKIADSGGRVEVKVDGVQDINFTGDTKEGTNTQFNKVRLGYGPAASYTSLAYFDNFIMDDAAWIGDTKIQKILPTGGGSSTIWTPSVGANWDCVNERPASDVDYISTNAVDQVDTYQASDMAGAINTVKCVQIQSRTESDGAPTPTNLKLAVRSGGTNYFSGDKSVPAAPKSLWNLWETNPADSLAWEEADVNAMEIGIKSAA